MLERDDLDIVLIATPWGWHTPMAVDAMKAGKHAFIEVPAVITVEECWELVEAQESTGRHCMMMENVLLWARRAHGPQHVSPRCLRRADAWRRQLHPRFARADERYGARHRRLAARRTTQRETATSTPPMDSAPSPNK